MYEYHRKPSLVWPIILIGAGILFLLNNLGIVDWDVWLTIGRLWPLILVAIGFDIILGRSSGIWPALAFLLIIALFTSGAWLVNTTGSVLAGELHSQEINQPLDGVTNAKIDVDFGVGQLEIGKTSSEDMLVDGVIELTDSEVLDHEHRTASGTAYVLIASHGQQFYPSWWFTDGQSPKREWKLYLTEKIPIELDVDAGVGKTELDLRQLKLDALDVDCGVGEMVVYLPSEEQYTAYIDGGVGQLKIYVPEDLAVRIVVDSGLGNTSVVGDYNQSGNTYTSASYGEGSETSNIYVNGGVGNISIIELDH